jgi:rhodanese-related sulfurtransferase
MSDNGKRRPLRISAEEARERYNQDEVTVLDVVDPWTYERLSQQIEGAVRIDPRKISDNLDRVPRGHTVLTY